jgi:peroxiredoxin
MKPFIQFLILPCMLLPLISFSQQQKKINYEINGEIRGLNNDSMILFVNNYDDNGNRLKPDTIITVANNNKFNISGTLAGPRNVWALIGGFKTNKSFSFFLEKGHIKINGEKESPDNISVTGTQGNNDQTQSRKVTNEIYSRIKALRLELKDKTPDIDEYKDLVKSVNLKFDSIQAYEHEFIREHPNSQASGSYLYVLQDKIPLEELEDLYNNLGSEIKNSGFGLIVREKIKARKFVAIGNMAPEFASTDTSGSNISLSSFRGKYVLLEFWASWCVPCRQQSPHLIALYKKYSDKGFTILQYSMDDKTAEEKWKAAIRKDQLTWTQVSDLNGFESKVSKLYGVQPIPDNFLIDPQGKIIGRRLEGKELENKLNEVIK